MSTLDIVRGALRGEPGPTAQPVGCEMSPAERVVAALQAHRDAVFGPGNDDVWGEGNWVRCDQCPDALGWPSYHHKLFHT